MSFPNGLLIPVLRVFPVLIYAIEFRKRQFLVERTENTL